VGGAHVVEPAAPSGDPVLAHVHPARVLCSSESYGSIMAGAALSALPLLVVFLKG
jgi:hypothetical protein